MGNTDQTSNAYLVRDGDVLLPGAAAQGPWGPTISGHVVGGILARSLEDVGSGPGLQPARLTVDLLRPTAITPLEVRTTVRRDGRRIRLVDAELLQDDVVVSRASAMFLRRGEHPVGDVWSSSITMPPLPPDPGPLPEDLMMFVWGYGGDGLSSGAMGFTEWHDSAGPKYAWIRQVRPLVAGEITSPFVQAAMAADATSALSHWGTGGLRYINADYTLTLARAPVGEYIGLAAISHNSHDGVAAGAAAVFDEQGPIGNAITVGLVNPVESFHPRA
ncbi:thioesterase family protein [Mycobacterium sp. CVI_P3]|uniref:Thioesterase family protein n=1 Tax=Mycobacterium pinniadriaticum TaxID=2994102 RepID=A0ABT3S808_9MYCO|nr:acyl-CoA thioesterase domain-containing protein [Mycobacterium pinniadriaticum]MCX2929218.1 thioesterase family protein [Mycobacterium pinniadriaticum]MCX2935643.1 thioesterase family protein [Mycobacterium pinniadriaticum]